MFATIKCLNAFYNKEEIILNNPILFDASCNGLQHLAALTREVEIAVKTNLIHLDNSPALPPRSPRRISTATLVGGPKDITIYTNIS